MKKTKKAILVFVLFAVFSSFAACGENEKKPDSGAAGDDLAENADAGTNEEPQIDFASLPAADYGGADFNIANLSGYDWCDTTLDVEAEETGDILNDAIYKRNQAVAEKYNVKLNFIDIPHSQISGKVKNQMLAGASEYEMMQAPMRYDVMPLSVDNFIADANKLDQSGLLDLSNPWWDQFANSSMSICKKIFYLFGDFTLADKEYSTAILFNAAMQKEYGMPDFYQIVREGDWTLDTMLGFMRTATKDLDGDGKWTKEDQFGLVSNVNSSHQLFYGMGETMVKKDGDDVPYWVIGEEAFIYAYDKVWQFLHTDNAAFDAMSNGSHQDEMFADGKALFDCTLLAAVRAPKTTSMRGVDFEFGLLPSPKLDASQERYYNYLDYSTPCMAIINNDGERLACSAQILEALNARSGEVQQTYMQYALPLKYFRDEQSFEMFDIMMSHRIFDIAGVYNWGGFVDKIRADLSGKKPDTLVSCIEANLSKAQMAMEETLGKILD